MYVIIDCGSSKVKEIQTILFELGMVVSTISEKNFEYNFLQNPQGIIISGSPKLISERIIEQEITRFEFLKQVKCPVLGICYGHQIIGLCFGSKSWKGNAVRQFQRIEQIQPSILMKSIDKFAEFTEDHTEYIDLPENFDVICRSSTCENEAMQHNSLPIFGVQFHPESSGKAGRILFENFAEFCKKTAN